MKPRLRLLSTSHVLTCLGRFLLTFSLFFFLPLRCRCTDPRRDRNTAIQWTFGATLLRGIYSAVWTEMEEKGKKKKKNRTCQRSHLCAVSNYCLPVLWFGSVDGLLSRHSPSTLFSIICIEMRQHSFENYFRLSLSLSDLQWGGV